MKSLDFPWKKCLMIGAAAVTLPLTVLAHGPNPGHVPDTCAEDGPPQGGRMMPPPGMFPGTPPPGMMLPLPYLNGLDLSETQRDKLFELMLAQAPLERASAKEALKAMDDLRRLAVSDKFDADKARTLADTHAKALSQVILMHAELDAKVRILLTPTQRKLFDDMRKQDESRHQFNRP